MRQSQLDQVAQVYLGKLGSSLGQKRQRARVDWLCAKAEGQSVLDVGCSQGMLDLLLAQAGKQVLALDIEQVSIDYLNDMRAAQPPDVQALLTTVCADFLEWDSQGQTFDCVYMTELLEHVEQPERFLSKAATMLAPGVKMIVSVPFGINAHPDHLRTYYFLNLLNAVRPFFRPMSVDFLTGWICIEATTKADDACDIVFDEALLRRLDEAFHDVDQLKQRTIDNHKQRFDRGAAE